MHVFISGASGLIGSKLVTLLERDGHQVTRLTRRDSAKSNERTWNPGVERLSPSLFEGCEALIHLAGENIGDGRWTAEKKKRIHDSRVKGTRLLAEAISELSEPPRAMICASAIGYYGDRGAERLTEKSPPGEGFLADVCRDWEQAADPARMTTRVVHIRTGVVLSPEGGALAKMLLPFKLGVGGVIGNGRQFMSWISLEDSARLFQFALNNDALFGPVNGTSPHPVTNREFTKTLGKVLTRPTIIPMPAFAARLALGEMAEALILASTCVLPEVATSAGFQFSQPTLEEAFRSLDL